MAKRIITLKPFTYAYPSVEPMPEKLLVMDFTTDGVETSYYASQYHELMINEFTTDVLVTVSVDGYEYELDFDIEAATRSFSIMTDAETTVGTYFFESYGYEPNLSMERPGVHNIKVYVNSANVVQVKATITFSGEYSATNEIYAHVFENGVGTPKRISPAASVTFKMLCFTGVDVGDEYARGYINANDWEEGEDDEDYTFVADDGPYWRYEQYAEDGKYPDATASLIIYEG